MLSAEHGLIFRLLIATGSVMSMVPTYTDSAPVGISFRPSNPPQQSYPATPMGRITLHLKRTPPPADLRTKASHHSINTQYPLLTLSNHSGFENLAYDGATSTLYAMLQSATIQDGGSDKTTSRHSRLFAYDVGNILQKPKLIGEWVVPLPQSSKGKTLASSEIYFLSPGVFLALARDGDGRGGDDTKSKYKYVFRCFPRCQNFQP